MQHILARARSVCCAFSAAPFQSCAFSAAPVVFKRPLRARFSKFRGEAINASMRLLYQAARQTEHGRQLQTYKNPYCTGEEHSSMIGPLRPPKYSL